MLDPSYKKSKKKAPTAKKGGATRTKVKGTPTSLYLGSFGVRATIHCPSTVKMTHLLRAIFHADTTKKWKVEELQEVALQVPAHTKAVRNLMRQKLTLMAKNRELFVRKNNSKRVMHYSARPKGLKALNSGIRIEVEKGTAKKKKKGKWKGKETQQKRQQKGAGAKKASYTFLDAAEDVLRLVDVPLTAMQIWEAAQAKGFTAKVKANGKTPWRSLQARVYVDAKIPGSTLVKVAGKPARFWLKERPLPKGYKLAKKAKLTP
jgi:hypothetical protein